MDLTRYWKAIGTIVGGLVALVAAIPAVEGLATMLGLDLNSFVETITMLIVTALGTVLAPANSE